MMVRTLQAQQKPCKNVLRRSTPRSVERTTGKLEWLGGVVAKERAAGEASRALERSVQGGFLGHGMDFGSLLEFIV